MILSPFYVIADADFLSRCGLDLREFALSLRAAGVGLVQWRCKDGSPAEVLAGAAILREVFAETECRLILNDRIDLALLAGFDGVHVGQDDLSPAAARAVLGSRLVGISTHAVAEIVAADASDADYVAIGPVFATGTKLDAAPVVGLAGVRRARELTRKPLVAIGGITLANCRSVRDAGADSLAVISGLLVPGRTVEETARDFLRVLK